ncbi:MAG: tetratricopeptide repeat protein [Acidobacteria bacterium]|nr:tetratricopeptide repeat protein [Candidatus Sulfomarinibacter kjeldsenii]
MTNDPLHRWKVLGVAATAVIVLSVPAWVIRQGGAETTGQIEDAGATFVGREVCRPCHEAAFTSWQGSDHDLAMDMATAETVRGDFDNVVFTSKGVTSSFFMRDGKFFVNTEGPDGELADFEITHTFGHEPLQQYLVPFPGGRLQCLSIAWDADLEEWFDLNPDTVIPPDDWLHWTRAAQTWNGMCAECHSTNLLKNFDASSNTYNTTWSEIDVSCEACHGPGSEHVAWADIQPMARPDLPDYGLVVRTGDITSQEQVDLCAPCHSRRSELGDWDHSTTALLDSHLPSVLDEGLYHADGQILDEVYVWGSFTQSKMYANDVRCTDCHDAHSMKLLFEGNDLCLQCHRADAYDTSEHHFHKKIHEGEPSDGALCIKCHMPEQPYMVIDERADHSLRVPRPDLSQTLGTPNACSQGGCHDDRPLSWSVDAFTKWYGQAKKPHYGPTLAAGREGRPEALDDLVRLAGDELYPAIVRATALSLLGRYPGEESTRAFAVALADPEALLRHTAVNSFVASSPEELVELVAPLLFDPMRAVRLQAAVQLADAPDQLLKPYQREALADTLAEYRKAMEHSLDFAFAGHNLGNLAARLGDAAEAERYYRAAVSIDDLFYPAKANLAVLLNARGQNDEAEALLRSILEAYPEQHDVAYSLGLLLAEMGRYIEAESYLARAAAGMPDHPGAARNLRAIREYLTQRGAVAE